MTRVRQLPSWIALAPTLGLVLGAAGCGKFREVSACRSVARQVNGAADEIDALAKAKPPDELRIAKRHGELAKALQPRATGETPLAAAVRDYVAILHGTETALRAHDQLAKTPYPKMTDSKREIERLAKREHATATRIDAECHN